MAIDVQTAADPRWSSIRKDPYRLLIGGQLVPARDGAVFASISPRDNRPIAKIAQAGVADVADAVAAARAAMDGPWGRTTAKERNVFLLRIADLIESHADELAFLESVDAGKPISSVHYSDLPISLNSLRFFGGRARLSHGAAAEMPDRAVIHHELLEPMGVVAEILPWNGPLWTGVQRMAAILAAGNAAIMKPAQMASLTFMRLAELLVEADLPAGVVNVVAGPGGVVGDAIVEHPGVDMVSVTGGIETGSRVLSVAATRSSASRSNWAARTPTSSSPMPISTRLSSGAPWAPSGTPARSASAGPASSSNDQPWSASPRPSWPRRSP